MSKSKCHLLQIISDDCMTPVLLGMQPLQILIIGTKLGQLWYRCIVISFPSPIPISHSHTLFLSSSSLSWFLFLSYSSLVVFLTTTTRPGGKLLLLLLHSSAAPQPGHRENTCFSRILLAIDHTHTTPTYVCSLKSRDLGVNLAVR